ncbi:MAG: hypothetical protein JWR21_3842 [Herminiimonas sp.]|nr:hypothetical protein [Herminiimonas sp.]MDB5853815.1 hypothetical protein [Herminiimonas sp.]
MRLTKEMGMLVMSAALAGCGGGGGGDAGTASAPLAGGSTTVTTDSLRNGEGVYEGALSNGMVHDTIVLEDGSYYSFYGTGATNAFVVKGSLQGTGTGLNGVFASTNLRDYMADGTTASGSLGATYTAQPTFNGYVSEGSQPTVTFTGAALSATNYVYASAPVFSNIVGTWPLTSIAGVATTVTVAADNTFSGNSAGCTFTGTITPRPSGKNIYNVTMAFGGAPCASPNQAATGIALDYLISGGKRQLLIVGADATRANGIVLIGAK